MKVGFMRWVDHWIGVPICFLLSLVAAVLRLLGLRKLGREFQPRRILFIELSEMGSTILAYAAMERARGQFGAEPYFLIFEQNAESVRLLDLIPEDNLITIRSHSFVLSMRDALAAVLALRARKIDTAVDLELFSRFTAVLSFLSGAKAVVGFYRYEMEGLYRGSFQTHRVRYNPYYHMSRNFLSLIGALEAGPDREPMLKQRIEEEAVSCAKITSSEEERARVMAKLQQLRPEINADARVVLLNPGASQFLPIRKWPIEHYIALARRVLSVPSTYVVVIGVASDRPEAKAIADAIDGPRVIDFTGQTANLRELVDLYNISKALVTNDSGPAHFASLTDIRNVVLFGPETPDLYGPLGDNCVCLHSDYACSPCVTAYNHRKTSCTDSRCLQQIQPDEVFEAIRTSIE